MLTPDKSFVKIFIRCTGSGEIQMAGFCLTVIDYWLHKIRTLLDRRHYSNRKNTEEFFGILDLLSCCNYIVYNFGNLT